MVKVLFISQIFKDGGFSIEPIDFYQPPTIGDGVLIDSFKYSGGSDTLLDFFDKKNMILNGIVKGRTWSKFKGELALFVELDFLEKKDDGLPVAFFF